MSFNYFFFSTHQSPSHKGKRQQQELIAELRKRQGKDTRHVYEGKDGAIEDIITGTDLAQINMWRQKNMLSRLVTSYTTIMHPEYQDFTQIHTD